MSLLFVMLVACGRVGFEDAAPDALALATRCGCGDADGNGTADLADVTAVAQQLSGLGGVACPDGADANLDGAITRRDLNAMVFGATGRVGAVCGWCTATCGDLSGDGVVDGADILALDATLTTPGMVDACLAWTADTTGDGTLDDDDRTALDELISGGAARRAP